MSWQELAKQLIAKTITVGATAVLYQGADIISAIFIGGEITPIEIKALLLIAAYAMWSQAIVPFMNDLLKRHDEKIMTTEAYKKGKSAFDLI